MILIFWVVGIFWHAIIKHLRETQIANAFVVASISLNYSVYLGHNLLYPFNRKDGLLRKSLGFLGYTSLIDIIIAFLNSVLVILAIFNIWLFSTGWTVLIIIIVLFVNYHIPTFINYVLLKYEPVFLKESIKRYIDILGYNKR